MKKLHFRICELLLLLSFPLIVNAQKVRNPLSQVTDFNLKKDGTFVKGEQSYSVGDYFSWEEAQSVITPENYHVPSRDEAMVLFGEFAYWDTENKRPYPYFSMAYEMEGMEKVCIWGETAEYYSKYKGNGDNKAYAIRFIGEDNKYLSAYRWEPLLTGSEVEDEYGTMKQITGIKITCRLLGPEGSGVTIEEVSDEEFWEYDNSEDVEREFVACGFIDDGNFDSVFTRGRYWTTSKWANPQSNNSGYGFGFDADLAYVHGWEKSSLFNIRLFLDADIDTDPEISVENPELNPLNAVADYNLMYDGTFAYGDIDEFLGDFFTWEEAQNIKLPDGYHIPTREESRVLFGEMDPNAEENEPPFVQFTEKFYILANESVSIWGEDPKEYVSKFKSTGNDICYAVRFIGGDNKYLSAFRWELLPSGGYETDQFGPMRCIYGVKATSRLLGPDGLYLDFCKIANEDFWNSNNENDVTKLFPANGFSMYADDEYESIGIRGRYWTSSQRYNEKSDNYSGYGFGFDENWAFTYAWAPFSAFSLRCFKDNPNVVDNIDNVNEDNVCDIQFYYDGKMHLIASQTISGIAVYDITGKEMYVNNNSGNTFNVSLNRGVYILKYKLNVDNTGRTKKIIIR